MIDRQPDSAGLTADDRAVSEVVAFILVFAIILISVGVLYSTGFQAMNSYQEHEQSKNAERAMESLADNFNDVIRYNGVNQRYGELSLREGTVSTSDSGTTLNITIPDHDSNPIGTTNDQFAGYGDNATVDLGEFAYTSGSSRVAYEGGGLVRAGDSGDWSLVRKYPQLKCGENAATISLVAISADDRSIQSSSGLGFTMSVESRSSKVYNGADSVSIAVDDETEYEDAWNDIFTGDWDNGNENDLTGECDDLERVVVTIVEVDLEY